MCSAFKALDVSTEYVLTEGRDAMYVGGREQAHLSSISPT